MVAFDPQQALFSDSVGLNRSTGTPLVSLVILARDDNYMWDFKYRLETTLNHICKNLLKLGRRGQLEIIVVDWGSTIPLSQTLDLETEVLEVCRFVYVPIEAATSVEAVPNDIHRAVGMNVGVRRASGEFIMQFAGDTLMTRHSLESLLRVSAGDIELPTAAARTYLLCPRYCVSWEWVANQPTVDQWERYLQLSASWLPAEEAALLSLSKGVGAYMMHKSLWNEVGGFDENLPSWGWHEVELASRVTQRHGWLNLANFGVTLYHMEHPPVGAREEIVQTKANPKSFPAKFRVNGDSWGLADTDLPTCTAKESRNRREKERQTVSQTPKPIALSELNSVVDTRSSRKDVRSAIDLCVRSGWTVDTDELEALFLLSWYSKNVPIFRYLEYGALAGNSLAVVAKSCPCSEIYGIDTWEGVMGANSPLHIEAVLRRNLSYQGYLRFLNGELSTALGRLKASFPGKCEFDLAFLRLDGIPADANGLDADSLCSDISAATIVVCSKDSSAVDAFLKARAKVSPVSLSAVTQSGHSGIVISSSELVVTETARRPERIVISSAATRVAYSWFRTLRWLRAFSRPRSSLRTIQHKLRESLKE